MGDSSGNDVLACCILLSLHHVKRMACAVLDSGGGQITCRPGVGGRMVYFLALGVSRKGSTASGADFLDAKCKCKNQGKGCEARRSCIVL